MVPRGRSGNDSIFFVSFVSHLIHRRPGCDCLHYLTILAAQSSTSRLARARKRLCSSYFRNAEQYCSQHLSGAYCLSNWPPKAGTLRACLRRSDDASEYSSACCRFSEDTLLANHCGKTNSIFSGDKKIQATLLKT